jgi:hypothetical protein
MPEFTPTGFDMLPGTTIARVYLGPDSQLHIVPVIVREVVIGGSSGTTQEPARPGARINSTEVTGKSFPDGRSWEPRAGTWVIGKFWDNDCRRRSF